MAVPVSPVPSPPRLRWSGGGGGGYPDIGDYIQGLQMLGGVLALPRSAQYAQQDAEAHRRMLEGTGVDPADIRAMYPDAPMQWLAASDKGVGGKILGGVGDVGALISTIAGQPIGPPRMGISEVAQASKLRKEYKEQQELAKMAETETDPVGKALLATGSMDGYARYKAAQLRSQGGMGMFGTSAMGQRARLAWLEANQPDSPDIPALRRGIAEEDLRHPIPPPPQKPLSPREQFEQKHAALMDARHKEATETYHYEPGSDEYNHFMQHGYAPPKPREKTKDPSFYFNKALEIVKGQTLPGSELDMGKVNTLAAQLQAADEQFLHPAKPGAPPPGGQEAAPPPPPPARPEETRGPVSSSEQPPSGLTSQRVTGATPEQLAARQRLTTMAQQQGIDPRGLRETNPDLWATADLSGTENLSAAEFYRLLGDPVAFAEWRAGQAAQTQQAEQPSPSSLQGVQQQQRARNREDLTPAGQAEFDRLMGEVAAKRMTLEEARTRAAALPGK